MTNPPLPKNSESSYGRFSQQFPTSEAANAAILHNRALLSKSVDLAIKVYEESKTDTFVNGLPAPADMLEIYLSIRSTAHELFGRDVTFEHSEYVVISEFTRLIFKLASPTDPKAIERVLYTGSDVLLHDRRKMIAYSMRPWAVLFERFLESQKNTEWSISTSFFGTWSDPKKCILDKKAMNLTVRAHLSALGRRLAELDSEDALIPMKELLRADTECLMATGTINGTRMGPLSKAKASLTRACHHSLSNISLYRNRNGLAL